MMCTPKTRSLAASARTFTKPSVSALQRARELAVKAKERAEVEAVIMQGVDDIDDDDESLSDDGYFLLLQ